MREKDIKKLFDICAGSGKIDNDSEKIKSAVMKKIGISNAEGFYTTCEEEEAVKPVFVTAPKKNKGVTAIKIAAVGAAAAACVGVTALCTGIFGEGGILSALPKNNTENNKNVPTETDVFTDVSNRQNVNSEIPGEDNSMQLVFLDGVVFTYDPSDQNPYRFSETNADKNISFLYEKNGRLYIAVTEDGKKRTEDITDKISYDDFYLFTYNNPDNIADQTHYVIVGGDVSANDYGYIEIYKVDNSTDDWGWEANFSDDSNGFRLYHQSESWRKQWITNGVEELAKKYGVPANVTDRFGHLDFYVDFKYVNTEQSENAAEANAEITKAEFLFTEDGMNLQITANKAAIAYLRSDKEELSRYLIDENYDALSENSSNIFDRLKYMVLKLPDPTSVMENDGVYSMVYQILLNDSEMIIYLDLELRKTDSGWKVEYIYLQG